MRGHETQVWACVGKLEAEAASSTPLARARSPSAGLLDLGHGRPSEALDQLLFSINTVRPESNPSVVLGVPDAAEAALRAQRLDDVRSHFDHFERWVERYPNRARLALLARCRALVEGSDADRHYAEAIELADSLSPFERARTDSHRGVGLRRHRRRSTPAATYVLHWQRSSNTPRRHGQTARAASCAPVARAPANATPPGVPTDTSRAEYRRPADDGLTKAEIGAQLFLPTIDHHQKVFAKLDTVSRADRQRRAGRTW